MLKSKLKRSMAILSPTAGVAVLGATAVMAGAPSAGAAAIELNAPIVSMTGSPSGHGYWEVGGDGGVFAFGDATFYGSPTGLHPNASIVAIAATSDGRGYWVASSDGGGFAYGDANFYGSAASERLNAPIVAVTSDASDKGYWLASSDGGVFAYGNAAFAGSAGGQALMEPVVSATAASGGGYWLNASDGGIFSYGGAGFYGSLGGSHVVSAAPAPASDGVTAAEEAEWERVALCEEGGNWAANGSTFSGGLGISRANWAAYGGLAFAAEGSAATEDQQIIVAMRIQPSPPDQNGCTSW